MRECFVPENIVWTKNISLRKNGFKSVSNLDQKYFASKKWFKKARVIWKKIFCFEKMVKKA